MEHQNPQRKPPQKIRAIDRQDVRPDVITAAEMQEAADLQATAWLAERNAREFVQRIEHRLRLGATIENCSLTFDFDMQMVRTKREERAG